MPNYWYQLCKEQEAPELCVIYTSNIVENVTALIFAQLLDRKREHRLSKLLADLDVKDLDNAEARRNYLPDQYKGYANDLEKLKEQMASLYEISQLYHICDIKVAPDCYGCLYDCGGQRDHMECPTGCLHNSQECGCHT